MNDVEEKASGGKVAAPKKPHANIVFVLSLILLTFGVSVGLVHRYINTEMILIILLVCFSLSLSGALMLFYFLRSTAYVEKGAYRIGGAAAGFFIMFGLLYMTVKDPALYENRLYKLANSNIIDVIYPVAEAYREIESSENVAILKIAESALNKTRHIFNDMRMGRYIINAYDLPIYLMPMIDNAKEIYYATQYVLPEKFWEQLWATEYFQKNVSAAKERNVDLRRIFILTSKEAKKQKEILEELMRKHVDNQINIRIIFKDNYQNPDVRLNLSDFVVADNDITGALVLNREGGFTEVEFSTDDDLIARRKSDFERLWAISISYDTWKSRYYDIWSAE